VGGVTFEAFRTAVLWLMFAASFIVIVEPAPSDALFGLVFLCYAANGFSFSALMAPLIVLLMIYNLGGLFSYFPVMGLYPKAGQFIATSIYMAITAITFSFIILQNPDSRIRTINRGWIFGATIASVLSLIGALNIAGLQSSLSVGGRALGLFKDPNVLSTYLIYPVVVLVQNIIIGRSRNLFGSAIVLLLIFAAIFLAFSRGAWVNVAMSTALLVLITFVLTPTPAIRFRIVFFTIAGTAIAAILLAIILSIPSIWSLFLERFSLNQSYDVGETGRFGNQANSIPLLLGLPLGFGPRGFPALFGEDPHNVFINAFASYGWAGGIAYLVLTLISFYAGIKTILLRGPWQTAAIAVFCPLFATSFQGVQIDTDHWRHYYWMLGITWGLFAATVINHKRNAPGTPSTFNGA
jgi:hypothetical protein